MIKVIHKEYFDIYDINENKLGYKVLRGKPLKKGEYHIVVEVITITKEGKLLVTRRHPNKHFPLYYEFTGGSVIAGETALAGAKRELCEETGINANDSDLIPLGTIVFKETIYKDYLYIIDEKQDIILQPDETIGYHFIHINNFDSFLEKYDFVPSGKKRYLENYKEKILELMKEYL